MPYIVTEPVKIPGTKLGYAVYPYQKHFLDKNKNGDDNTAKLLIFEIKNSKFIEVEKTLFEKEFSLSMQNAKVVDNILKKFIVEHERYVDNVEAMSEFFSGTTKKMGA